MKRLHMHIKTTPENFEPSIAFYNTLFGSQPTKSMPRYAKWMLEEPRINFVIDVIENPNDLSGVHHVGIQVEESEELALITQQLKSAEAPLLEVGETTCCFSHSEKNWTVDPSGVRWETFRTLGDANDYGEVTLDEETGSQNEGGKTV